MKMPCLHEHLRSTAKTCETKFLKSRVAKQLAGTLEKYRKTCETKFLRSRVAKRLAGTLEEHQKYKKENEDEQQRKVLHDHRDCLHIR